MADLKKAKAAYDKAAKEKAKGAFVPLADPNTGKLVYTYVPEAGYSDLPSSIPSTPGAPKFVPGSENVGPSAVVPLADSSGKLVYTSIPGARYDYVPAPTPATEGSAGVGGAAVAGDQSTKFQQARQAVADQAANLATVPFTPTVAAVNPALGALLANRQLNSLAPGSPLHDLAKKGAEEAHKQPIVGLIDKAVAPFRDAPTMTQEAGQLYDQEQARMAAAIAAQQRATPLEQPGVIPQGSLPIVGMAQAALQGQVTPFTPGSGGNVSQGGAGVPSAGGGGGSAGMGGGELGPEGIFDQLHQPVVDQALRVRAAAENVAKRENELANFYNDAGKQQSALATATALQNANQQERMAKYQAAFDQAAKDLGKYAEINPSRAWANLGTGGQIAAALAAGAAGFLNPGGPNSVVQAIGAMVDKDIDAQKATFYNNRDKTYAAHTAFGMALQRTQDEETAAKLAQASMLDNIMNRAKGFGAKVEGDKARQALEELMLKLAEKREEALVEATTKMLTSKTFMRGAGGGGGSGGGGPGGPAGAQTLSGGVVDPELVVALGVDPATGRSIGVQATHGPEAERLRKGLAIWKNVSEKSAQLEALDKRIAADRTLLFNPAVQMERRRIISSAQQELGQGIGSGVLGLHEVKPAQEAFGALSGPAFYAGTLTGTVNPGEFAAKAHDMIQNQRNTLVQSAGGKIVLQDGEMGVKGAGKNAPTYTVPRWVTTPHAAQQFSFQGLEGRGAQNSGPQAQPNPLIKPVGK